MLIIHQNGSIATLFLVVFVGYLVNAVPDAGQIESSGIISYLGGHIFEWIIADVFGVMIGAAVSALTSKSG